MLYDRKFIDILVKYIHPITFFLSTPGLEGTVEFLRAYCSVFTEVEGGWGLCPGVTVPRCRELRPNEDYSVHDTPPGQKVSTASFYILDVGFTIQTFDATITFI